MPCICCIVFRVHGRSCNVLSSFIIITVNGFNHLINFFNQTVFFLFSYSSFYFQIQVAVSAFYVSTLSRDFSSDLCYGIVPLTPLFLRVHWPDQGPQSSASKRKKKEPRRGLEPSTLGTTSGDEDRYSTTPPQLLHSKLFVKIIFFCQNGKDCC